MPASLDIEINRGNSFTLDVTLVDSAGDPLDLSGSSFLSVIHARGNVSNPAATLTVTTTGANERRLTLTAAETSALLGGSYRWELQYTDANGEPWDLLAGTARVLENQQGAQVQSAELTVTSTTVSVTVEVPGTQGPAGPEGPEGPVGGSGDYVPAETVDAATYADTGTDASTHVQALIDSLSSTGGVVYFPAGVYTINSQLTFPDDSGTPSASQPSIRLTGAGHSPNGRQAPADGGTILELGYSGADAKILTLGHGLLEIDHLTLRETTAGTTTPFLLTTNTTVHLHHLSFYGHTSKSTTTCDQDAIVLGGTSTTVGTTSSAPFQGYGTTIKDCYFSRIRRGVYGRTYCNATVIRDNTWWNTCGTNLADGAALELLGTSGSACSGNLIDGNLFEMPGYVYATKFTYSSKNSLIHNSCFDLAGATVALHKFGANSQQNFILVGFSPDTVPVEDNDGADNRNTYLDPHASQTSRFADPVYFRNDVTFQNPIYGAPDTNWTLSGQGTGDLALRSGTGTGAEVFVYVPQAGAYVQRMRFRWAGGTELHDNLGNLRVNLNSAGLGFNGATPTVPTLPAAGSVTAADVRQALIDLGLCT